MNETIDALIKICLSLEAVIAVFLFSISAFAEEKKAKKPTAKKMPKPEKKLEVHPAVRDNPELFAFVDGRVVLRKNLR